MRFATALAGLALSLLLTQVSAEQSLPDQWSYVTLGSHWRVSGMLDGQVYSDDGRPVGRLHDLIFDHQGQLQQLVVESETRGGWRYFVLDWAQTRYSSAVDSLTLSASMAEVEALPQSDTPDFAGDAYEASNLMGLLVNLSDRQRWGQVTDLLISPTERQVSAMVVESLGPGRLQYAAPPYWDELDYDEHLVTLPYTVEVIEGQGRMGSSQPGM